MGSGEQFVETSAKNMFLFPLIGGLIGLFAATYYQLCNFVVSNFWNFVDSAISLPTAIIVKLTLSVMTLAFLLVLTGLQHFDGLVDLGNALGLQRIEERRSAAHAWIVTYKGAFLAILIEFIAIIGLFFLKTEIAFQTIISAEVAAKLAMVTIVAIGQSTGKGLGARFIAKAKTKRIIISYFVSILIFIPLLRWLGFVVISISIVSGLLMEKIAKGVFGGVSGDMIGATNEISRALVLVILAGVFTA